MAGMLMEMLVFADSASWLSWRTFANCNLTLARFALTDVYIGLDCARTVSSISSTADLDEALINYTRDLFDAHAQTVAELSSQLPNATAESDAISAPCFWD